jgi:hypothetical protein
MKLERSSSLFAAVLVAMAISACVVSRGVSSSRGIDVGDPAGPTTTTGTDTSLTGTPTTTATEPNEPAPSGTEDAGADAGTGG